MDGQDRHEDAGDAGKLVCCYSIWTVVVHPGPVLSAGSLVCCDFPHLHFSDEGQ